MGKQILCAATFAACDPPGARWWHVCCLGIVVLGCLFVLPLMLKGQEALCEHYFKVFKIATQGVCTFYNGVSLLPKIDTVIPSSTGGV